MVQSCQTDVASIRRRKASLILAVERKRSTKWILQLWSRFIREHDSYRCVCCKSSEGIEAHHIVRKTLYPWGATASGNGITLCGKCHKRVHEESNGRADLALPLSEGDDQDEWAFLFGLLNDDAEARGLDKDEFYFLDDHMLRFFVRVQGYEHLYERAMRGECSRIRFAHAIWQRMPEAWYKNVVSEIIKLNL